MPSRLIASLEAAAPLAPEARRALEELAQLRRVVIPAGTEFVAEGEPTQECRLLLVGHAFRHRTLSDGRRQIMNFHVPGDFVDLQGLVLEIDHSVTALSECEVAIVPHARLNAIIDGYPAVTRALWRFTLLEGAVFREWMVGMGRRSAYARIAHLLCEVFLRLRQVGLVERNRCRFPVTQTHLSDALGLSVVHTNRVLQALRANRLVEFNGGELVVLDWPGLTAAGEFDPSYLHLRRAAA